MKKRIFVLMLCAVGISSLLASCANKAETSEADISQPVGQIRQETGKTPTFAEDAGANAATTDVSADENDKGITVYIDQNDFSESNAWYPDIESFLQDFGFAGQAPFYEYYDPDGSLRMSFYYNETTEEGCGVRYYDGASDMFVTEGIYGFTFQGVSNQEWSGWEGGDGIVVPSESGEIIAEEVKDYTENVEYDEGGRITHFDAQGILTEMGDTTPSNIWKIDFAYHENGQLQKIDYWHTTYLFGTFSSTRESYFDDQGRLLYEDVYVTHGSMDYYYLYEGDSETPKYCLHLDFMHSTWIPEFTIYGSDNLH